jgi:hypothetical protein
MGTLAGESIAGIEEHLLECPFCQHRLAEADEFLTVFRAAAMQIEEAPERRLRTMPRVRFLWAGAAAAMVFLAVLVSREPGAASALPATVAVQSLRGPEAAAHVAAGRPFLLVFDITASPPAVNEIQIVNAQGNEVLKPSAGVRDGRLTASVKRLPRGVYWVRVYRRQELVAEYGLQAE